MQDIEWLLANRRYLGATIWQWIAFCLTGCLMGATVLSARVIDPSYYPLLLIMVMAPFAVMLVGDIKKLLLVGIILEIPIQLDKYFFYNDDVAENFSAIGGISISVTTLCLIVLYVLWIAEILTTKKIVSISVARTSVWLAGLYILVAGGSTLYAPDFILAFSGFNLVAQSFLLFLYIAFRVRTEDEVRLITQALMVTLLIQSIIMILVYVVGNGFDVGTISFQMSPGRRPGGTMGSANGSANSLILLLTLTFSVLLTNSKLHWRLLALTAFGAGIAALLLTSSRGGWLGFVAAMAVFFLGAFKMRWVSLKLPILMLCMVMGLGVFGGEAIIARLSGPDGGAVQGRIPLMYLAAYIIRDNFLLGVGINNFTQAWDPYLTPEFYRIWLHTVHNKYLLVWSETGIFGIIFYVSFLFSLLIYASRTILTNAMALTSPLALGMLAGIAGVMVHMNTDILNGRAQELILWLICGLLVANYNVQSSSRNQELTVQYPFVS